MRPRHSPPALPPSHVALTRRHADTGLRRTSGTRDRVMGSACKRGRTCDEYRPLSLSLASQTPTAPVVKHTTHAAPRLPSGWTNRHLWGALPHLQGLPASQTPTRGRFSPPPDNSRLRTRRRWLPFGSTAAPHATQTTPAEAHALPIAAHATN
jgi:hypothetical protein